MALFLFASFIFWTFISSSFSYYFGPSNLMFQMFYKGPSTKITLVMLPILPFLPKQD